MISLPSSLDIEPGRIYRLASNGRTLASVEFARMRVRWCVAHDRAAVPSGWWVRRVDPVVLSMAISALSAGMRWPPMRPIVKQWLKPHYRWQVRR